MFGVQFLSLKNYDKLLACQSAIVEMGIRPANLDDFVNVEPNDNVRVQTKKFAALASSSDSYFSKLNKTLKQNGVVTFSGDGNSIEDTHMAQYNEGRIARMLLQERLTSLELSKTSKTKTVKRAGSRARKSG